MASKPYKPYFEVDIDKRSKPEARKAIAQDIIDFVVKRTLQGKKPKGGNYPAYSKGYIKSLDFKLGGKSASKVNLRLSFEMLNSIVLRDQSAGKLEIGIGKGDTRNAKKSEGNEIGSYGGKPNSKKARPFLDISKTDLKKIEKKYPLRDKNALQEALAKAAAIRAAAAKVVDEIKTDAPGN